MATISNEQGSGPFRSKLYGVFDLFGSSAWTRAYSPSVTAEGLRFDCRHAQISKLYEPNNVIRTEQPKNRATEERKEIPEEVISWPSAAASSAWTVSTCPASASAC